MDKYEIIKPIGDGTFGSVSKARVNLTGEVVAIKKMKKTFSTWDEAIKLREVKSLRKMSHPNIVKLKEVIRLKDNLYFVFEYMEKNLYENLKEQDFPFSERQIKMMAYECMTGLAGCHKQGFFHRDLKPENLLVNDQNQIKLADFGLAREIRSRPPFTDYVSTRWYRAPELLLASTNYNSPIDIFAMGCIIAEMYLLRPLFPGNSEADQLNKIVTFLGTPPLEWTEGYQLAALRKVDFPKCTGTPFANMFPTASAEAIDLMEKMLQYDANKRPTAVQCLSHPYFTQDIKNEYNQKTKLTDPSPTPQTVGVGQEAASSLNNQHLQSQLNVQASQTKMQSVIKQANNGIAGGFVSADNGKGPSTSLVSDQKRRLDSLNAQIQSKRKQDGSSMFNANEFKTEPTPLSNQYSQSTLAKPAPIFTAQETGYFNKHSHLGGLASNPASTSKKFSEQSPHQLFQTPKGSLGIAGQLELNHGTSGSSLMKMPFLSSQTGDLLSSRQLRHVGSNSNIQPNEEFKRNSQHSALGSKAAPKPPQLPKPSSRLSVRGKEGSGDASLPLKSGYVSLQANQSGQPHSATPEPLAMGSGYMFSSKRGITNGSGLQSQSNTQDNQVPSLKPNFGPPGAHTDSHLSSPKKAMPHNLGLVSGGEAARNYYRNNSNFASPSVRKNE